MGRIATVHTHRQPALLSERTRNGGNWARTLNEIMMPGYQVHPRDTSFFARIQGRRLPAGGLLASVEASGHEMLRERCEWSDASVDDMVLLIPRSGTVSVTQNGECLRFSPGEVAVGRSAWSMDTSTAVESHARFFFLRVPFSKLVSSREQQHEIQQTKIRCSDPMLAVLLPMIEAVSKQLHTFSMAELAAVDRAMTALVMQIYAGLAPAARPAAVADQRYRDLLQHIECCLDDPALSVATCAQQFKVSARYIHKLFSERDAHFSEHLMQRRLERIRIDLTDTQRSKENISTICFRWGFNDAAHFSRVFKERFGLTPREFRQLALPSPEILS